MPRPKRPSVCAQPCCPNDAPCPLHARRPWEGSNHARTQTTAWRHTVARIRRRDRDTCYVCGGPGTIVDHLIPHVEGGTDDDANLACICKPHHDAKTQREAQRGRQRAAQARRGWGVTPTEPPL